VWRVLFFLGVVGVRGGGGVWPGRGGGAGAGPPPPAPPARGPTILQEVT
jgi:hypothetical protein